MSDPTVTVVVIDADKAIRRFVRTSLEAAGMSVFEAQTGAQGLAQAATRLADLVIIDLSLPDMDGIEVIRELRGWSAMPVIVLSARSREEDKVAALDAGADDYLTKPFGLPELSARIRAHLRRQTSGDRVGLPRFSSASSRSISASGGWCAAAGPSISAPPNIVCSPRWCAILGAY
jgi:two-component system KDP operon response regulator KdpE